MFVVGVGNKKKVEVPINQYDFEQLVEKGETTVLYTYKDNEEDKLTMVITLKKNFNED